MAWSASKIFRAYTAGVLTTTVDFDILNDVLKVALYNNSVTPDSNASAANTAYNADQWAAANEVAQAGQWDAGGVALNNQVVSAATADTVFLDADNVSSNSAATLADVYGALLYDDTLAAPVADQGIGFVYFGGANSVVSGTFTILWSANGILRYVNT